MSLCRCYGNQLPRVFETQIINLLPVYIGSQNTKQFQYVNLDAVKLSPHSFELLRSQYKTHKLPMPWRVSLFSQEHNAKSEHALHKFMQSNNLIDTFTVWKNIYNSILKTTRDMESYWVYDPYNVCSTNYSNDVL